MQANEIGRIRFVDDDVEPMRLLDFSGACIIEIVHGQYRVEKLPDQGEKKASVP
jgi:hypothetical protein